MYFEPAKKTYHRFPSASSVNDFDTRYYFPEKTRAASDDMRLKDHSVSSSYSREKVL